MDQTNFLKENKVFILIAIIAVFFLLFLLNNEDKKIVGGTKTEQIIEIKIPDYQSVLNGIQAKSFYVYDVLEKKVIFSKNEHLKLPLASITKLMSGLVILDIMPDTTIITIGKEDIDIEGDSGLKIGEKWKLKDLLEYSLMTSSNDGMHAMASSLNYYLTLNSKDTIETMNERARLLNLNDTFFINETGLDVDNNMSGAYSSAYDVSLLLENVIKNNPALISGTNNQKKDFVSESKIKHTAENTNVSVNEISGLLASKTGMTNLAGGNLAVVFDAGFMHPIVVVVLGSTIDGRFADVVKLSKITLEKLSN